MPRDLLLPLVNGAMMEPAAQSALSRGRDGADNKQKGDKLLPMDEHEWAIEDELSPSHSR